MTEFVSTPIPTEDSAPRGFYHVDNYAPIYYDSHASVDPVATEATLAHELGRAPTPAELQQRIGQIATRLTEIRIEQEIDTLIREGGRTPLDTQLGEVQYGFNQAEQDRLPPVLAQGQIAIGAVGSVPTQAEVDIIFGKISRREALTPEESRRVNEVGLSQFIIDMHGNPTQNPRYEADPMNRMQLQVNLSGHISGLSPRRPGAISHHHNGDLPLRDLWRQRRRDREERAADRSRTLSMGPQASQNYYGVGRLKERRDEISQEALTRNVFTQKGSIFRYLDVTTGVERHFVVEGAHARQVTHRGVPLFFLNDDGSMCPVAADEYGNILNDPVANIGTDGPYRSVNHGPQLNPRLQSSPNRIVDQSGNPVAISKENLRTGCEITIFRPLFTEEEQRQALRHGIISLATPEYEHSGGTAEMMVAPRFATVDDMVFASISYGGPLTPRPRAIEKPDNMLSRQGSKRSRRGGHQREAILQTERVWQSDNEMTDDEYNNPAAYPPAIIVGAVDDDRGRFVNWDGLDTTVINSADVEDRIPGGFIREVDRASATHQQRRYLKERDLITANQALKRKK